MEWSQRLVDRLDLAFNESQVFGLGFDDAKAEARLLIEVLALPEVGPLDPDPRRVAVFTGVSTLEVTLEPDFVPQPRPVLPLESLAALETFFGALTHAGAMYGWSFVDREAAHPQRAPSLVERSGRADAGHSFSWFTECGRRVSDSDTESYVIEGLIRFEQLRIERADGRPLDLEEFLADAQRWWDAFQDHDERLSSDAQRQANATTPSWRSRAGTSTMVPENGN